MSHFWNSDHFQSLLLTDGWGKYSFTRKSHMSTFVQKSSPKIKSKNQVHIQSKFMVFLGGMKKAALLNRFIFSPINCEHFQLIFISFNELIQCPSNVPVRKLMHLIAQKTQCRIIGIYSSLYSFNSQK